MCLSLTQSVFLIPACMQHISRAHAFTEIHLTAYYYDISPLISSGGSDTGSEEFASNVFVSNSRAATV